MNLLGSDTMKEMMCSHLPQLDLYSLIWTCILFIDDQYNVDVWIGSMIRLISFMRHDLLTDSARLDTALLNSVTINATFRKFYPTVTSSSSERIAFLRWLAPPQIRRLL
jgi:hypothetical protein